MRRFRLWRLLARRAYWRRRMLWDVQTQAPAAETHPVCTATGTLRMCGHCTCGAAYGPYVPTKDEEQA